jgi:hypothetical protein
MAFEMLDITSPAGKQVLALCHKLDTILRQEVAAAVPDEGEGEDRTILAVTASMALAGWILGRSLIQRYSDGEFAARRTFEATLDATFLNCSQRPEPDEETPDVH